LDLLVCLHGQIQHMLMDALFLLSYILYFIFFQILLLQSFLKVVCIRIRDAGELKEEYGNQHEKSVFGNREFLIDLDVLVNSANKEGCSYESNGTT